MAGDGTISGGHRIYTTSSPRLADDVQQLILTSGRPGSISFSDHAIRTPYPGSFRSNFPVYRVREGSQSAPEVNNKAQHDWLQEDVDEDVYCVTVPSRILLVRRNRKVFLCSNCYDSFGLKAGKRTNAEYIENTQSGSIPHGSIMYHAKFSFFLAGISRRVSHELIRHYVGADRAEEGSPSQESTRYVEHAGHYIAHPAILDNADEMAFFAGDMERNYAAYLAYIERREAAFAKEHGGEKPKGMDRKRIFESASPYLSHSCETSFVWTTNPIAGAKLIKERVDESADLEFQRLGRVWKTVMLKYWPNLFPQPWMTEANV